jgi:VWFA-related protein
VARQNVETHPQGDTFKFETKLNVVLVPVQVRDAHGQAVGTLKKEDFQVFDKGKPQILTGFTIQERAPSISAPATSTPLPSVPVSQTVPTKATVVPTRVVVFLFDDLHLSTPDLVQAEKASTRMLGESLAPSDVAAVLSLSGKTNSGLTQDRAKLTEAIMSLREQRIFRPAGRLCPDVSYYQANLIQNQNDSQAFESAVQEAFSCGNLDRRMRSTAEQMAHSSASQSLAFGEQGTRVSLKMIKLIVQKMAALPGQHSLILVSPGFLSVTPEGVTEKSEIMDMAAQANVTINALDSRGLYVTEFDASEPGASTEVMRTKSQYHRESLTADEDVMAELAEGTGGTYFHNSNDLEAGFRKLTLAPEYLYLLEFTPQDVKQDGTYHNLKVTVDRQGLRLQARRGYYSAKANKKKS